MPLPSLPEPAVASGKPIVIQNLRRDLGNGSFVPEARLYLDPAFRTSGLLLSLPAEELRTLLVIFTFLHPNGHCHPSMLELSRAFGVSEAEAKERVQRLAAFQWQDRPPIVVISRENGLDAVALSPHLFSVEVAEQIGGDSVPPIEAVGRTAVIAWSRSRYARPRLEVEREIARLQGWEEPEETLTPEERDQAELRRKLQEWGIVKDQVETLLQQVPLDQIRRQLDWMPYRHEVRNPSGFLSAAILGDYEPPRGLPSPPELPIIH